MKHQQLADRAYARWKENSNWNQRQFWNHLDFLEKVAVFTGNLNYQVENGGFVQWIDNGYSDCSNELITILEDDIGTETAKEIAGLIEKALQRQEYDDYQCDCSYSEMDDLDSRFYEINEQFLGDVEAFLTA